MRPRTPGREPQLTRVLLQNEGLGLFTAWHASNWYSQQAASALRLLLMSPNMRIKVKHFTCRALNEQHDKDVPDTFS